jgi:hypothetical protein
VSSERLRKSPLRDAFIESPLLAGLRRRFVPRAVRDRVKRLWQMRERPELSPASRARLESAFDADLVQLGAWLGAPLACTTFAATVSSRSLEWERGA